MKLENLTAFSTDQKKMMLQEGREMNGQGNCAINIQWNVTQP